MEWDPALVDTRESISVLLSKLGHQFGTSLVELFIQTMQLGTHHGDGNWVDVTAGDFSTHAGGLDKGCTATHERVVDDRPFQPIPLCAVLVPEVGR